MSSLTDKTPIRVVVSQPMYFPWAGILEQIRLADIFVHYDDVQFARGFFNRVQVKVSGGMPWLTVPTVGKGRGIALNEIKLDNSINWRAQHRATLAHAYAKAPYKDEMLTLVDGVFSDELETLADLGRASVEALAGYFDLLEGRKFISSSEMGIGGSGSQRLLDIVQALGGRSYVTGHGALQYLDHDLFEVAEVSVDYMSYQKKPYPQLYGEFTPFVTALDLIANCGRDGRKYLVSETVGWQDAHLLVSSGSGRETGASS